MKLTVQGTPSNPQFYSWGSVQPDRNQPYDELIKQHYIEPMIQNVKIFDGSQEITSDELSNAIQDLWFNDKVDPNLDQELREIYNKLTPFNFTDTNLIDDLYGLQALNVNQLPHPSNDKKQMVIYTIEDDIIPSTNNLYSKWGHGAMSLFFASLYGFTKTRNYGNVLFVAINSDNEWQLYKETVTQQAQALGDPQLIAKASQFSTFPFAGQISQSVILQENMATNSFEHCLLQAIHELEPTQKLFPCPTNIKAQIMPAMIVYLNISELQGANPVEIANDLKQIQQASILSKSLKMITSQRLRTAQSIVPKQNHHSQTNNKKSHIVRRQNRKISSKPLSAKRQLEWIIKTVKKYLTNRQSQNVYKTQTKTFMRPNRRNPFDPNLMGSSTKTSYRPDIHIFFDTSGSITEDNYKAAAINIIKLALKMNVDIYVSFFSHVITKPVKLHVKGRTAKQIFNEFIRLPKVGGGTDFNQFWDQINLVDAHNQKSGKSYRLNFVITDFCDRVPRSRVFTQEEAAVKNTFYLPIMPTRNSWDTYDDIVKYAKEFAQAMYQKGIDIYPKLIM
jgi:hypothetical protein